MIFIFFWFYFLSFCGMCFYCLPLSLLCSFTFPSLVIAGFYPFLSTLLLSVLKDFASRERAWSQLTFFSLLTCDDHSLHVTRILWVRASFLREPGAATAYCQHSAYMCAYSGTIFIPSVDYTSVSVLELLITTVDESMCLGRSSSMKCIWIF